MPADPKTYHFTLPPERRPPFRPLSEQAHPEFEWLTSNRSRSREKDVLDVIDTVVVHATAGYSTQDAVDAWKKRKASAHWIVPDEDEPQHGYFVWATVAEAKAAFHVGAVPYEQHLGKGPNVNNRSLGIEITNTQDVQDYKDPYSKWQIEATAMIILYAWAKYRNLKHVISHAKLDPTRRGDPGRQFPWDTLKSLVLDHAVLPPPHPLIGVVALTKSPKVWESNCCTP